MTNHVSAPLTDDQEHRLERLLVALRAMPSSDGLLNPYASASGTYAADSRDEIGADADAVRLSNFRTYVRTLMRAGTDVILCGEAPGYAGCRFSGCAFSDEVRIAQQQFPFEGCEVLPMASAGRRALMEEQSARIVWGGLARADKMPLLFNAVQLHPHEPGNALTNRTPKPAEVEYGKESLERLIELVQPRLVVAVGRTAERSLSQLGQRAVYVRHPARGGKNDFLRGLEELGVIGAPPPNPQRTLL